MSKWTPGPWKVGEYDDFLGYDGMTGGIRVGPVTLDGYDYGEAMCDKIAPEQLARMEADARLISAAPEMVNILRDAIAILEMGEAASRSHMALDIRALLKRLED